MKTLPAVKSRLRVVLTLQTAMAVAVFCLAPTVAQGQLPGTLIVAGSDGSIKALDTSNFSILDWAEVATTGYYNGLAVCNDRVFGANTQGDSVDVFNATTGAPGGQFLSGSTALGTTSFPWAVASDGTSNLFVGFQDGSISEFNATTGTPIMPDLVAPDGGFVYSMTVFNDQLFVLALNSSFVNGVSVYNATTGALINPSLMSGVNGNAIGVNDSGIFLVSGSNVSEYSLTGSLINGSVITGMGFSESVAVNNNDVFAGDYSNEDIDESTVGGTVIGDPAVTLSAHPTTLLLVPEPAIWSLLSGAGALMFAALRRKKI